MILLKLSFYIKSENILILNVISEPQPYGHFAVGMCGMAFSISVQRRAGLAENTTRKKLPKSCHLGTIPQLCRPMSSQLRHVLTIGKKLVKQQYRLHVLII